MRYRISEDAERERRFLSIGLIERVWRLQTG